MQKCHYKNAILHTDHSCEHIVRSACFVTEILFYVFWFYKHLVYIVAIKLYALNPSRAFSSQ